MSKTYKHLFFDLDHTLWDFDRNTSEAISEIYKIFNFAEWPFHFSDFMKYFHETNDYLWNKFNHGQIDRMELRNSRFNIILEKLGIPVDDVPSGIGDAYLDIAPSKSNVIDYTHEILQYLRPKYQLHIISNGFDDVQHRKMKAADIYHYFDKIVTSDNSGYRKPQKEIFDYALHQANASRENSIFIGDNMDTDIIGAQNAAIDHIYYNPQTKSHSSPVTYEIKSCKKLSAHPHLVKFAQNTLTNKSKIHDKRILQCAYSQK